MTMMDHADFVCLYNKRKDKPSKAFCISLNIILLNTEGRK